MERFLVLIVVLLNCEVLAMGNVTGNDLKARIDSPAQLFEDYWNWTLKTFPETATAFGLHDDDDKLDSHSLESHAKYRVAYQRFLDRDFQHIASAMDGNDQQNLNILEWELAMLCGREDFKEYQFSVNNLEGSQISFADLIESQKLDNEEDYRRYLSRLQALPQQVYEDISALKSGLNEQRTLHNLSMNDVPRQISLLLVDPEETIYFKPFQVEKIPKTISNETAEKLRTEAIRIIKDEIQVAYTKLKDFITKDYVQGLRPDIGLSTIPGGKDYYAYLLKKFTSTPMSAEEIHAMGVQEIARIDKEMNKIIAELGYNETLREFAERLHNDSRFTFNSSESILLRSRHDLFDVINPALPKLFWKLPKLKLEVKPTPDSSTSGAGAFYLPGSVADNRPGTFLVTVNHYKDVPVYDLLTTCLHEGNPGHHFQISYFQEKQNVPNFRKNMGDITDIYCAYIEGWALYAEYLGLELGLYKDPYDRYGHYSWENFRAARLVVDTGIHEFGWTRQEAINYLVEHTAASLLEIEHEVDRYITNPGQATAYKVGELKIRELRSRAETELGSKFEIKDFHDSVLDCGNVPLNVLELCVNKYIDKQKNIK